MTDCVLAIDQGTTGTTALLLDRHVSVIAVHNVEFPNHYPKPGWVEHDVHEIWASIEAAVAWITGIIAEPEVGEIYTGKVVKVVDFGAFINFIGTRDGLCHISELADYRVKAVNDICNEGDQVFVKCLAIDDRGKVRLSMKMVDQETGTEIVKEEATGD